MPETSAQNRRSTWGRIRLLPLAKGKGIHDETPMTPFASSEALPSVDSHTAFSFRPTNSSVGSFAVYMLAKTPVELAILGRGRVG